MTFSGITKHKYFRAAVGALLCVGCGFLLPWLPFGDSLVNASYDRLIRFGSHPVTNDVVLVLMDNDAHDQLVQPREAAWNRSLHAQLLNKLADDGCPLVIMDVIFRRAGADANADAALATAMTRLPNVVLNADLSIPQSGKPTGPQAESVHVDLPFTNFLAAAKDHWGIPRFSWDEDDIVRRHWPFPSPGLYPSTPWVAAKLSGAHLDDTPVERWFRYYDFKHTWASLSYQIALHQNPGYFRNKIVFVGSEPKSNVSDGETDKFRTPHYNWNEHEMVGGITLLVTEYLNLMNGDALRRWNGFTEVLLMSLVGIAFGAGLTCFGRWQAVLLGVSATFACMIAAVLLSYYTNYWFPWLIVVAGQFPVALIWAVATSKKRPAVAPVPVSDMPPPTVDMGRKKTVAAQGTILIDFEEDPLPDAPEYEFITPEIGRGGFGKVWIVRNAIGQWQALKAVFASNFGTNRGPYEAEFKGLQRYKPVSEKHPGLLRIDLVSKMKPEGYFYYIMELGDAQTPGWEKQPNLYKPRDLENLRKQAYQRRLPVAECLRIVSVLADALSFLHQQGLTHRDIKPSNVIFVNGRPKLADVGLVADIRPLDQMHTMVGTLGYMPPPPEKPGTAQADIFALGMVLYVIGTGCDPGFFPDITTNLMERSSAEEFMRLNAIILKACQPDLSKRYQTTADMVVDLKRMAE